MKKWYEEWYERQNEDKIKELMNQKNVGRKKVKNEQWIKRMLARGRERRGNKKGGWRMEEAKELVNEAAKVQENSKS